MWLPAGPEDDKGSDSKHEKKKSHKSKHKSDKKSDKKSRGHADKSSDKPTNKNDPHVPVGALTSSTGTTPAGNLDTPGPGVKQMPSTSHLSQSTAQSTGQPVQDSSRERDSSF